MNSQLAGKWNFHIRRHIFQGTLFTHMNSKTNNRSLLFNGLIKSFLINIPFPFEINKHILQIALPPLYYVSQRPLPAKINTNYKGSNY